MRGMILLAAGVVAGCAQTGQDYQWVHPELPAAQAESQETIDSAECQAQAYQAIALPALPASIKQETTVVVDDKAQQSRNASHGKRTHATGSATTDQYATNSGLAGAEQYEETRHLQQQNQVLAQHVQQYEAAVETREKLAEACMVKRGWRKLRTRK